MSIPKRGSRHIIADDREYLWYIRRKPTYDQEIFESSMIVAIQASEDGGSILLVAVGSRPDNAISPHQTAIKPSMVRDMIAAALRKGWRPMSAGEPFELRYPVIRDQP